MTVKNKNTGFAQCTVCGFLKGGHVPLNACTSKTGVHRFKELDSHVLASALGSRGGRPPTYATEEERMAARRETFIRANNKRRGLILEARERNKERPKSDDLSS